MATIAISHNRWNRTTRWLVAVAGLVTLVAAIGIGGRQWWRAQQAEIQRAAVAQPPQIGVTQLGMQNLAYAPAHVQVQAGTTVTWINRDSAEHDIIMLDGSARSPLLGQNEQFSHTFNTPGTYQYVCSDHAFMFGKVTVTE